MAKDLQEYVRVRPKVGEGDCTAFNFGINYPRKTRSKPKWGGARGFRWPKREEPGESIELMLSADPPVPVKVDIYRLGDYQGLGGRQMRRFDPLPVAPQPTPRSATNDFANANGRRACSSPSSPIGPAAHAWRGSRVCQQQPESAAHVYQSYVIFIVRGERRANVAFQCVGDS